jgi:hypothetical protein
MNSLHFIWMYLWIVPHVLVALAAWVMFRTQRYRDFPVFFGYLLFEVFQFCVLFAMIRLTSVSASTYQQADMLGRAGSIAFRFGIIQEILEAPVIQSPSLLRTTGWMLKGAAACLALLAVLFIGSIYSWDVRGMIFPAYAVKHTLNIVQCGLIVLVFFWHRFLRLKMEHFVLGIALGMGLVAGLEPLLDALKDFRTFSPQVVDLLQMGAYHVATLIWLAFASVPERYTSSPSVPASVASVQDARRWATEMGRLIWP